MQENCTRRTIQRAYKTELDPNQEQRAMLARHAGAARFIYNLALERQQVSYQMAKASGRKPERVTAFDLNRELTDLKRTECPWLYEVNNSVLGFALRNLDAAYANFFRRAKEGKTGRAAGHPRFQKRKVGGRFKMQGCIHCAESAVTLPNIGSIRVKESGYLPKTGKASTLLSGGRITSATVSECAGRWYVSFQVEEDIETAEHNAETVGIDLGISHLATLSDDTTIDNPRWLRQRERKLKRLQRQLSRKKKGSKNRRKAVQRVARHHQRVAQARQTFLHQTTTAITKRYGIVVMEDLNVAGMVKNHHLAKSISDASFAEFRRQIAYKLDWRGGRLVLANRFYPSSKTCSECGAIKQDLSLSERRFVCVSCGVVMDRDLNAAINLRNVAAKVADTQNACGVDVSLGLTEQTALKQEPICVRGQFVLLLDSVAS